MLQTPVEYYLPEPTASKVIPMERTIKVMGQSASCNTPGRRHGSSGLDIIVITITPQLTNPCDFLPSELSLAKFQLTTPHVHTTFKQLLLGSCLQRCSCILFNHLLSLGEPGDSGEASSSWNCLREKDKAPTSAREWGSGGRSQRY